MIKESLLFASALLHDVAKPLCTRKELKISPEDPQGRVVQLAKERARELMRRHQ